MASVYCTFLDASGEACSGTVSFTPSEVRGSADEDVLLGGSRVDVLLDEDGEFDIDLEGGNYRCDIRLKKASTYSREISVPDGGQVNLKWLLSGNSAMPSEVAQAFTAVGPYIYQVPWWSTSIDVVGFGGGGAGADGTTEDPGLGGGAGATASVTLVRGVDIPWDSTTITGSVGAGGVDGAGTASTASSTGMADVSASGGTMGAASSSTGESSGDLTVNGVVYKGGATQTTRGAAGKGPGGGGGGGNTNSAGGAGADGAVYFRAFK